MPYTRTSLEDYEKILQAQKEAILHMPMQPLSGAFAGKGQIEVGDKPITINEKLDRALKPYPNIKGFNNHMGSAVTSNYKEMNAILDYVLMHQLFFIDSYTTAQSVCTEVAKEKGLNIAQRDVFLDNIASYEAINEKLEAALKLAEQKGKVVVIGIESSCDDCSLSLVKDGREVLSLHTAEQVVEHKAFYGVVPEIASRLHAQHIDLVYKETLLKAGIHSKEIDLIAVSNRPGLVGSLNVGVSFAKGLAMGLEKPLIGVDHILAHLYAPFLDLEAPSFLYPYLAVLVSGGHTLLAKQTNFDEIEVLGTTLDDACGEAFDKVAKFYDLGFPGGPVIDAIAQKGDPQAYRFPLAQIKTKESELGLDLSFSGLKTAVIHQSRQFLVKGKKASLENLIASFQKVAIDSLINKIEKACQLTSLNTLVLGGGVSANSYLRLALEKLSKSSEQQVEAILKANSLWRHAYQVVDPVFADNGKLYTHFNLSIVDSFKELIQHADLITPNITEASYLLTGKAGQIRNLEDAKEALILLSNNRKRNVLITSVEDSNHPGKVGIIAFDKERESRFEFFAQKQEGANFCGTGDVLTSTLLGLILSGLSFEESLSRAFQFINESISYTLTLKGNVREGIIFEPCLRQLTS
ncbi:UNVERIFIED_CONTAM: hypothetical protein PYX00_011057 [Menopon gallinae]|uniref:N(6)-L-threonylcarbamoyladenine synthase n=1 Tax=Menopon gallinae TaxID=328185 RepID=A0AAW2H6S8_9NEOP